MSAGQTLDDDAIALLPVERMERLRVSQSLQTTFRDPRFQRVVAEIDSAKDRSVKLEEIRRREGKPFQTVLDEMLIAIGVCERKTDGSIAFIG
jgi:hypothetical protein